MIAESQPGVLSEKSGRISGWRAKGSGVAIDLRPPI